MSAFSKIRVLICDHLNLARGKYISSDLLPKPIKLCQGIFALSYDGSIHNVSDSGVADGLPDMTASYEPTEIRPSWEKQVGIVVADLSQNDQPMPLCARTILKQAITQWEDIGLSPMIGIELEGFLFQRSADQTWQPYHTQNVPVYSTGINTDPLGITDKIWQQSVNSNLKLGAIHSEYDWPQFEFCLQQATALTAIDNAFLFRLMAQEIYAQAGLKLSFMPKPLSDHAGSGVHINLSLLQKDGNNAFHDDHSPDNLTALNKSCIAGLLKHHQGLAALLAPSVNSYKRLRPNNMSGYWANWGYDNRNVAIRIPEERGKNTRIEYRLPDGAANPYIATAAMLNLAYQGYSNNYTLATAQDGNTNADICVADSLGLALNCLAKDKIIHQAMGTNMIQHFLDIKQKEWQDYLNHTTDWETQQYFDFL